MGFFATPMYPASSRLVAYWIPFRGRGWANGLIQGSASLGIACTPFFFGFLIDAFTWPTAFVITGVCTAVLTLLWAVYSTNRPSQHSSVNPAEQQLIRDGESKLFSPGHVPPELEPDQTGKGTTLPDAARAEARPAEGWHVLLRNRSLVLLTLSYAAVGYFEYLFFFWMQYYFKQELHLGKTESRLYATIIFLAMWLGMWLGGWLSDHLVRIFGYRRGRAALPVAGLLSSAVLLYLGVQTKEPAWIVTWFSLALGAVGATEGPLWTTAIELGGRQGATAAGIFNTGGNFGGFLAPRITPWVSTRFGWGWAISLGSIFCLLAVCLWWWIDPAERVDDGHDVD
jgi:sugar phosphate permease